MPKILKRIVKTAVPKAFRRSKSTERDPQFCRLKTEDYNNGIFVVHKNRASAVGVRVFGDFEEIEKKRVVGKGRQLVGERKIEVLLFENGAWDMSSNWVRVRGEDDSCVDGHWHRQWIYHSSDQDGGNSHGKRKKAARRTLSVDTCGSLSTFCGYEDTERVAGPCANRRNGLLGVWC